MNQLTNERNIAFLPDELKERKDRWLQQQHADFAVSQLYSQADFKGTTRMKSKEASSEFLPGELGVRSVRACQPTTMPFAPHFFTRVILT